MIAGPSPLRIGCAAASGREETLLDANVKTHAAYGKPERIVVQTASTDLPSPTIANDAIRGPFGSLVSGARDSRSRRRRQLIQLAEVVRISDIDFRNDQLAAAKLRNLERLLQARLSRRRGSLAVKRAIDMVGAAFGLILLVPLLTLAALAVGLTTTGPIIYSQLRQGLNGKPFRIYKFRTFYASGCDESGIRQAIPGDRRVTPVGRFLRRTNIDELPQLWNVLTGDMSLVGPRPHALGMHAGGIKYEELVLAYPLRTLVKPGITGLAQLRGFRGPTWNRVQARMRIVCDLQYVAMRSNVLDLRILVLTLLQELRGGTGG